MRRSVFVLPALLLTGTVFAGGTGFHTGNSHETEGGCAQKGAMAKFHALHSGRIVAVETEDGVIFVDTKDGSVIEPEEVPKREALHAHKQLI